MTKRIPSEDYERYLELETQKRKIEAEQTELKEKLILSFKKNKIDKQVTTFGVFSLEQRKSWKYSEKLEALKMSIKVSEKKEQVDGTAKSEVTEYMKFSALKGEYNTQ